MVGQAGAAAWW
jgi:hypothetical protein